MGLFSRKACAVCGGDMGIVTDNKLADGGLCKACAAKLSPWFRGMKNTTVSQIMEQMEYREANRGAVAGFNPTLSYGSGREKLLIDENNGTFTVTGASDLTAANPDILSLADITGCEVDIDSSDYEISEEGTVPEHRRRRYNYDFYVNISVKHPYFNLMRFRTNGETVQLEDTWEE